LIGTVAPEPVESSVKINRLREGGHTWSVHVMAASNSVDDLRTAKEKAVLLSTELEVEFTRQPQEEVPF
jgi:hypothetical protein